MFKSYSKLLLILFTSILVMATSLSFAQMPMPTGTTNVPSLIPNPPDINATAYVLMDANSGKVLAAKNMDQRVPPASLTKLMTIYLTFQALQSGSITLNSEVTVSKEAWQMGGSKMFIRVGNQVTVDQLLQGVIVDSGNDACMQLAQYIGGSEDVFVSMMNQQAQLLSMKNTNYTDSSGLPNPGHYSTAYDLALLTRAIIKTYPEYYHYFSQRWFTYNGIRQPNRNRLLWRFPEADGLKTGHTDQAGYCLIGSALKDDMRLISVVMGTPTDEARSNDSIQLLTYGFRFFDSHLIYQAGNTISTPRVWFGDEKTVPAGVAQDLYITLPRGQFQNIQATIQPNKNLEAPINKGQAIGSVIVTENNLQIESVPLVALDSVSGGGFLRKSLDHVSHIFHSWFGSSKETQQVKLSAPPAAPTTQPSATQPAPLVPQATPSPVANASVAATPVTPISRTAATGKN